MGQVIGFVFLNFQSDFSLMFELGNTEQSYIQDLILGATATIAGNMSVCKESIMLSFYWKQSVLLKGLPEPRLLGKKNRRYGRCTSEVYSPVWEDEQLEEQTK